MSVTELEAAPVQQGEVNSIFPDTEPSKTDPIKLPVYVLPPAVTKDVLNSRSDGAPETEALSLQGSWESRQVNEPVEPAIAVDVKVPSTSAVPLTMSQASSIRLNVIVPVKVSAKVQVVP